MSKNYKAKILLVDDDTDILEFLSYNLKKENYKVYTAENGEEAIEKSLKHNPDLILLDVMMPKKDGMDVCKELRANPKLDDIIICFLTARNEDYSQIVGFEAGADDYVAKPIKPSVLIKRIEALLKRKTRKQEPENKVFISGDLKIDFEARVVFVGKKEILLPKKEFKLLKLLVSQPGKVFTRDEIYSKVWGNDVIVGDRTIDVHIKKLREKIGNDYITTIKAVGYKLNAE